MSVTTIYTCGPGRIHRPGGDESALAARYIHATDLILTETRKHMTSAALTTDETAVRDVLDGLYAAWAAGDADGIARLYAQDATVVMPGVYHTGKEQVRAFFAGGFAGRLKGSSAVDESRSFRFLGDDAAIVVSEGGILMPGEATVPAGRMVRATWVLARPDGEWLITAYHNCPTGAG
jgi:uncharacterized protein (TIGR02246 family)